VAAHGARRATAAAAAAAAAAAREIPPLGPPWELPSGAAVGVPGREIWVPHLYLGKAQARFMS